MILSVFKHIAFDYTFFYNNSEAETSEINVRAILSSVTKDGGFVQPDMLTKCDICYNKHATRLNNVFLSGHPCIRYSMLSSSDTFLIKNTRHIR